MQRTLPLFKQYGGPVIDLTNSNGGLRRGKRISINENPELFRNTPLVFRNSSGFLLISLG